jgi:DICT domain-containing protein
MCSITIPGNTTGCRACKEAMDLIKSKTDNKESFAIVITFESGITHYTVPISKVQMEKLNNEFKFLK